jgi:hypothetical protein
MPEKIPDYEEFEYQEEGIGKDGVKFHSSFTGKEKPKLVRQKFVSEYQKGWNAYEAKAKSILKGEESQ